MADWHVLDEAEVADTGEVDRHFDVERRLAERVGGGELPPTLRLWRHRGAFVLGPRDARLPFAREAIAWLSERGLSTAVRPSGGWAVPLDSGVLNVSMIFAVERAGAGWTYRFDTGFCAVQDLIRHALRPLGFEVVCGEVAGGYCPGASDVAVGGRKVGGISQRVAGGAAVVQAFLNVEGSGADLARLAAEFYRRATGGNPATVGAPAVRPDAMASLAEVPTRALRRAEVLADARRPADLPRVAASIRRALSALPFALPPAMPRSLHRGPQ